uniref:Uncharacterized protein n=1 Tax=Chenopodium quinoa TaxID=63459 RepID=A0A803KQD2_CHEQI
MVFLVVMVTVMVGTCAADAAGALAPEQPQHELLPISNILHEWARGGVVDDNLSCIPIGHACGVFHKKDCCKGTVCKIGILPGRVTGTCHKCPGEGDFCGLFRKCCESYSCNGFFYGHCS